LEEEKELNSPRLKAVGLEARLAGMGQFCASFFDL
jgi:hypothetical protein